jgi:AcrR family transcriptional regulator
MVEPRLLLQDATLRQVREDRGISLRAVAGHLGVSPATLSGIETGRTSLTRTRLEQLSSFLEFPLHLIVPEPSVSSSPPPDNLTVQPVHWRSYPPLDFDAPLNAALEAFLEYGYHGATTREIARRAGMSVPGLYHHYETKQHMLVSLLEYVMQDLIRRSTAARAEGKTPVERFALIIESIALFHAKRRDLGFLGSSELRSLEPVALDRNRQLRRQHKRILDAELEAAVAQGEFNCDDPANASRAIVSLCIGLPLWFNPNGPMSAYEIARQYVSYSLQLAGYRKPRETLIRRLGVGIAPVQHASVAQTRRTPLLRTPKVK